MGFPDPELQRRRERGRRSQAAFRKRQAEASQRLTEENHRLRLCIEQVVASVRGDENTGLLTAIFDLAKAAGLESSRLPRHDASSLDTTLPEATSVDATSSEEEYDMTIDLRSKTLVQKPRCDSAYSTGTSSPSNRSKDRPQRLRCNIWLDPLQSVQRSLPPEDILPYLGSGAETFAGQLFWSVMEHSQIRCNKELHDEPHVLLKRGLSHSETTRDYETRFIEAMVEARLEYKQTGSISPRNAAAGEADLGMVVRDQINMEYQTRGEDTRSWLSCLMIEEYVRDMVGPETFLLFDEASRGQGDSLLLELMNRIKCTLYDTFICFGDGPRWHVGIVRNLFLNWAAQVPRSRI